MKKLLMKCGPMLASLALVFTTMAENSFCLLYAYQPELPEEAKKLSKLKSNCILREPSASFAELNGRGAELNGR